MTCAVPESQRMYPKVKVREEKYQDDEHVAVGLQLLESLSLHDLSFPDKEHQDVSPVFITRFPKSPLRNVVTLSNSTQKEAEQNHKKIHDKEKANIIRATFLTNNSTSLTEAEQNHKKIDDREKPNIIGAAFLTNNSTSLTEAEQHHKKIDEKEKPNIIGAAFLINDSTSLTDAEKNDVKINENEKQNIRASSILRPRAVLSSPNNDAVVGIENRLKAERPAPLRNRGMIPNRNAKAKCNASPTHIKSRLNTTSSDDGPANKSGLKVKKGTAMAVPSQRRDLRTWKF